jgi:DHA1 family multidrug resistance protein-like MFS transporter
MELWRKNLYGMWFAQFIAAFGLNMVVPFLPMYLRDLGVHGEEAIRVWSGIVFSAPYLVSAFMQPLWGLLGDRLGQKPMIIRAMTGLAVANALMGFSQTVYQFLVFRFLQGCLAGFLGPSLALVTSCTPQEKTGYALGTLQTSLITSLIVGPLIGGVLAHFMGSRPIFFFTGLSCLCGAIAVFSLVEEKAGPGRMKKKYELRRNLVSVFYSEELRKTFFLLILVQFTINFIFPFLNLYVESLNVPRENVGIMTGAVFGVTGIMSAVTAPFWGRKADAVGYHRILYVAFAGIIIFTLPQAFVTNAYQLLLLRAGLGIFVSGTIPIIYSIVRLSTDENERGGIYGIFQSGFLIGNIIGPLAGGAMAAYFGLRTIFVAAAGILCLAFFLVKDNRKCSC